jgi:hypothetical protein
MRPGGRPLPAARVAFALRSSVASPVRPASPPGFHGAPVSPGRRSKITCSQAIRKGVPRKKSANTENGVQASIEIYPGSAEMRSNQASIAAKRSISKPPSAATWV